MADESAESLTDSSAPESHPKDKTPRSNIERILVWSAIGALLIITGMEALAQRGYKKSLNDFEKAMNDMEEPLTLTDFETKLKSGLTLKTASSRDGQPAIRYKWPSLLRRYEMYFTVGSDDDQVLVTYSTNDDPAALIGLPGSGGEPLDDSMMGEGAEAAPGDEAPGEEGSRRRRWRGNGGPGEEGEGDDGARRRRRPSDTEPTDAAPNEPSPTDAAPTKPEASEQAEQPE